MRVTAAAGWAPAVLARAAVESEAAGSAPAEEVLAAVDLVAPAAEAWVDSEALAAAG